MVTRDIPYLTIDIVPDLVIKLKSCLLSRYIYSVKSKTIDTFQEILRDINGNVLATTTTGDVYICCQIGETPGNHTILSFVMIR